MNLIQFFLWINKVSGWAPSRGRLALKKRLDGGQSRVGGLGWECTPLLRALGCAARGQPVSG